MGCLAKSGHSVIGVDPQPQKVDFINSGKATIVELGIDELIAKERLAGRISATSSVRDAVNGSSISFICVGTPPDTTGHLNLEAVLHVAEEIAGALREKDERHVIAVRSTVLPGTTARIAKLIQSVSGKIDGVDFAVVSNPEFLREGTSIADFNSPPFTLVGSEHPWSIEVMKELYARIDATFIGTTSPIAEIMKYASNSFHALKIAFANEVGSICKSLEIDSREVMRIFCLDSKLNASKAYLRPGFAYGGSCLPKDLKGLRTIAHDRYVASPLLDSIAVSNEQHKERAYLEILRLKKQNIGFIGLSFKAGTDDLRESPIVDIVERLLGKGFNIRIYDPLVHVAQLTGANRDFILTKIPFISRFITDDLGAVVSTSDLIVVVNKEPQTAKLLASSLKDQSILDLADLGTDFPAKKENYYGIAW
jgi:GDP-mannose 6-dehydrogenase